PSSATLVVTNPTTTQATFSGLTPGTQYFVKIVVSNEFGDSATSLSQIGATTPLTPIVLQSGVAVASDSDLGLTNRQISASTLTYTTTATSTIPAIGSYIVGIPTPADSNSFLRLVTQVGQAGNVLTLGTSDASLEDVLESGEVSVTINGADLALAAQQSAGGGARALAA